ncbi:hypothetical protein PICMEDRAFT_17183 [Pichia membranifaciens NRRL Y-2026]|uniref:Protein kinase domain-containing protein n=1 Tax=Pichia membranifaciens NRRL Y-2026 TaxID=763406 RepID=A0A1E3NKS8_9ASCO|nr:hypothetical protein PICMEDRAFT_17183 [Pichia membranifaciens NRRL Y-2026]ODQ45933.1 hypothetical protein PICMEDRAFT_17183 [Pichia membranifaciens NRRL Y-2026]
MASLLDSVDCIEYLPLFEENDITPDLLPSLDKHAIKEMGVSKVGDRLRMQVLIKLTNIERIKKDVPVELLSKSINVAVNSMMQLEEQVRAAQGHNDATGGNTGVVSISVITQDGEVHPVDVGKRRSGSETDTKKKIVLSVLGTSKTHEWSVYYVDYAEGGTVHEVSGGELDRLVAEGLPEKDRLVLCRAQESVSTEAVNTSNRIHRRRKTPAAGGAAAAAAAAAATRRDREINQFMGGRPPSQMISTNLREYFPELGHGEIEDIRRKSMRLSMYSSKMMDRLSRALPASPEAKTKRETLYGRLSSLSLMSSRLSVYSDASYGVGMPLRMDHHRQEAEAGAEADTIIEDEHPNSIIELLDESDGDGDGDGDGDEESEEELGVISREVANGPSVWHKGPKIGQGSFGNVYLGLNGLTGELMAIKQVDMPQNETERSKKTMVGALKQEISLLKELSHDNIVRYLGSNTDHTRMYIFLEYVPGGSVSSMLKMYGPFEDRLVRNFTRQVIVGLVYLHSRGIIHRDIKGGNILVDNNGSVKIGDFGISKKTAVDDPDPAAAAAAAAASPKPNKRSSLQGSVFWMAPEVVKQVAYTDKADVWSVGCLVVEMYTGRHPYPGLSQMQAIFQIGTGRAQPGIPARALADPRAVEFLGQVLAPDYVTRPRAAELLALPFLQQE